MKCDPIVQTRSTSQDRHPLLIQIRTHYRPLSRYAFGLIVVAWVATVILMAIASLENHLLLGNG